MRTLHLVAKSWRSSGTGTISLPSPQQIPASFLHVKSQRVRFYCAPTQLKPAKAPTQQVKEQSPYAPNDHRTLGAAQDLFTNSVYSPGSPLFLPNGTDILNKLVTFLRAQYKQYGFREVLTPNIYKQSLWEISGHWQNYKDDMYQVVGGDSAGKEQVKLDAVETVEEAEEIYGLKPMNCPGHCLLFKAQQHSYRDLPVRYADFSPLHRNEVSGSLSGLTRVRRFHQDDAHIFCRPQQIGDEIRLALKFTDTVLRTFGLGDSYKLVLSTRPETDFIGSQELWDSAEAQLREALEATGRTWEINEGDGAFYGPKIDLHIQDSQGKHHQLSTIQLDMNLPQRFGLEYAVAEGMEDYDNSNPGRAMPVMIHRAIFGSLERFFALLIERYNGRWPLWLSPRQAILLTVNQNEVLLQAAADAVSKISGYRAVTPSIIPKSGSTSVLAGSESENGITPLSPLQPTFNVDMDTSARSISKKFRDAHTKKYNVVLVLGPRNLADGSIDIEFSGQVLGKNEGEIQQMLDGVPHWELSMVPSKSAEGGITAKMKMKVDDVHKWLVELERRFITPTLSYTRTLESRIVLLEAQIAKLKKDPKPTEPEQEQSLKAEEPERPSSLHSIEEFRDGVSEEREPASDLSREIEGLTIEDGRISFHGPTSLFQLPSGISLEDRNPALSAANELDGRKERLINNAWRERAFEQLSSIPTLIGDMKMNGPYYSDILLNAILSHSLRWCRDEPKIARMLDLFEGGLQFRNSAVTGLFDALKSGNGQIPLVQSLLLLSAQECGRGNRMQAWLYSGMAFRIVEDLGITIDSRKYSGSVQFSDEDVEIRNRLFWSCYFWDKLVSLYFGRLPIVQDSPVSPPRILLDDTAEIEIWTPHGVIFPEGVHYPPTQAHSTSCFMKMCSLAQILNQIIIHIYNPIRQNTECQIQRCVSEQSAKLEQWWNDLPPFLKLSVNNLPTYCPPSHIVTLNCVYHTTNILLHRPMLCSRPFRSKDPASNNANHLVQCLSSATSTISLYDLFRRTFGDTHVVLSLAYSLYTAASIFLLEIQALKYASVSTLEKLRYCLSALDRVKAANPVINTALGLIDKELKKLKINIYETGSNPDQQPIPAHISQSPQATETSPSVDPMQQRHPTFTVPPLGPFSLTPPPLTENQPTPQPQQPPQSPYMMDTTPLPSADFPSQERMYEIAPELFEAFSFIEPISTNVGTGFNVQQHLKLLNINTASYDTAQTTEQLKTAPLFSSKVWEEVANTASDPSSGKNMLPQFGLMGLRLATYGNAESDGDDMHKERESKIWKSAKDRMVYANTNAPWSTFICGSQGSGKSHTLSCMLENSLMSPSKTGKLVAPLTGLVLHYDTFTGLNTGQLCEAAYLCSSGIPVRVLVSPSSFSRMKKLYTKLPGLPDGTAPPQVVALKFPEKHLSIGMMKSLMAVGGDGHVPLYMEVVTKILREMAETEAEFSFNSFESKLLKGQKWQKGQMGPLSMRLDLLQSFLQTDPPQCPAQAKESGWKFERGSLTIIDLSCPFVDEGAACALFNICISIFLEDRQNCGRIIALDEAHKFLKPGNSEAGVLTETMLSLIRQQRHLATRVIIATQEPTLSPSLLDLCNVTIVHRFTSPAWYKMLRGHLAGAVVGISDSEQSSAENIFSKIVSLKTGEALVFCPSALLDVEYLGITSSPSVRIPELGPRYIKMAVRLRVTADGGRSILAQT
ncbi:hypothetical protein FQN57_000111 [Myotisia sp. PD_48]|nr:hypothetical protein FQN57_000111 [Myotisia sp. PD_48]